MYIDESVNITIISPRGIQLIAIFIIVKKQVVLVLRVGVQGEIKKSGGIGKSAIQKRRRRKWKRNKKSVVL